MYYSQTLKIKGYTYLEKSLIHLIYDEKIKTNTTPKFLSGQHIVFKVKLILTLVLSFFCKHNISIEKKCENHFHLYSLVKHQTEVTGNCSKWTAFSCLQMRKGHQLLCAATVRQAPPSYHCGVAAADELSDLVKDAFTVNAFVKGASLHDDRHRQQDLLANILLEAGERGRQGGRDT